MSDPVGVTGRCRQRGAPGQRVPPGPAAGTLSNPGGGCRPERAGWRQRRVDSSTSGRSVAAVSGTPEAAFSARRAGPEPGNGFVCADDLPDGLVVADHDGRVTVFNRAASRLTGIAAESAFGRDVRDVLALRNADDRGWWTRPQPYDGRRTRSRHPERSLYLPDGTELLVSMGYVRDRNGNGGPGQQSGTLRVLAITLRGTQERERSERTRADLVSTVAHELRSPLTSVKGFTATLLNKWPRFTDDQKLVMLETVNADADRVPRLITELLDVSRIESGRIEVHRELVDIPEQARKVIAGRVAAGDAEDRFRLEASPDLPETWLDADKIFQILANLMENAVRHGAGTVTIMVEPTRADEPRGVAVSVRDQGQGVAPELAPRGFRPFWRGTRGGGAGLGLFIVKGLVEAHGGTIAVHQAPGGGAEFRFTMPAGPPDFG